MCGAVSPVWANSLAKGDKKYRVKTFIVLSCHNMAQVQHLAQSALQWKMSSGNRQRVSAKMQTHEISALTVSEAQEIYFDCGWQDRTGSYVRARVTSKQQLIVSIWPNLFGLGNPLLISSGDQNFLSLEHNRKGLFGPEECLRVGRYC